MLYETGLRLYALLARLASPFDSKAARWSKGRKGLLEKIERAVGPGNDIAWFHCASLGEFEQGRPLIEAFREKYPDYRILLTFFSPSGYELRKDYPGADYVFYLPIDTRRNVRRFLKAVNPRLAVFIKYEFWKNYLQALKERGTRTYVVSAIFRPEQPFFHWYGRDFRRMLDCFDHIFVQNEASKELLGTLGLTAVTVAGDTRFDRVSRIAQTARQIEPVERFARGSRVVVAGSTWPKDDELLLEAVEKHPQYKFILVPHEIEEGKIEHLLNRITRRAVRYTRLQEYPAQEVETADVLVVDTVGILASLYQYGYCAYIGGGFGVGIHNILEAATFGLPLLFGPNYEKFQEAVDLIRLGGATVVGDADDLHQALDQLLRAPESYAERSAVCRNYVREHIGASERILGHPLL